MWWDGDAVGYLDQRALPQRVARERAVTTDDVVQAIKTLAVRGAPAIGVFGAYGVALAAQASGDDAAWRAAAAEIRNARPTAVNLMWAVDRVLAGGRATAVDAARAIHAKQRAVDAEIARHGAPLLARAAAVLTHCNTGGIATAGDGTALGVIIAAHRGGAPLHVYVDETRPLLQGARLTMFELQAAGVPCTLIVDSAAALTMRTKSVAAVIVGADRIARNGDTANKIGTLGVAIAAAHYGIPFYVAAPRSTFDATLADGDAIPIEERAADEIRITPADAAYNPAFDVTPGRLIAGIITEYGVLRAPYEDAIDDLMRRPDLAALAAVRADIA